MLLILLLLLFKMAPCIEPEPTLGGGELNVAMAPMPPWVPGGGPPAGGGPVIGRAGGLALPELVPVPVPLPMKFWFGLLAMLVLGLVTVVAPLKLNLACTL